MEIQVRHIKCTSFQFKYIGRIPVLPDYNGDYGCYLIRNIKHFHINNRNITACYSEYLYDLYHKHVIVRMLLDFPNVGTKLWPTVSQMETTFRRNALFWAIAQRVVVKNSDSCPNLGPMGCPETSVRNYHYSLRDSQEESSSHLLRGVSLKSLSFQGELLLVFTLTNTEVNCKRQ